jgi:hypothetical protein
VKRIIFGWLFILLYGIALLRPIHPLIDYYVNQDFFAKVLCINKDKPEMACNGKCILMQRLKQVSPNSAEQTPANPILKINLSEYPIGFIHFLNHEPLSFDSLATSYSGYTAYWPDKPNSKIFRPPC